VLEESDLHCYNDLSGVVDLVVTGGTLPYSYSWSNGYTGEDLVNVAKGEYTVTVTDAKGCEAVGYANVDEPAPLAIDIVLEGQNFCPGNNLVSATANVSGGIAPWSYLWNDPGAQITKTAYDLFAGNYQVKVTDINGCTATSTMQVNEPAAMVLNASLTEPSCAGDENGNIVVLVTNGQPSYTYLWSNNVFQSVNSNIPAGIYNLTVRDAYNCEVSAEYTLIEPEQLEITNITSTDLSCSGVPDGTLTVTATGGTGAYQYTADDGSSYGVNATITELATGDYIVHVKDENNCISESQNITLVKSESCRLVVFDAFSPNSDGLNDTWLIGNIENYPQCKVKIFNIWGNMVYSSDGYGDPWDGTYQGNALPSGTYYYIIDTGDGSEVLSGPVSIVK